VNYLRFADLKARGVVRNWTTLSRLVREQGFPAGVRLGAQTRARDEAEVRRGWKPGASPPLPAAKKQPHRNGRNCAEGSPAGNSFRQIDVA